MKTDLNIVREKIIAVVPEIMELKMGCHVWVGGGGEDEDNHYSVWEYLGQVDIHSNQDYIWRCVFSTFATATWGNFKFGSVPCVVLGRPIRLSDILYTIQSLKKLVNEDWYSFTKTYNLRDDDLSHQSPELLALLKRRL